MALASLAVSRSVSMTTVTNPRLRATSSAPPMMLPSKGLTTTSSARMPITRDR
ncbi:hypothetical protein D3C73_1627690 [compost metagenome]